MLGSLIMHALEYVRFSISIVGDSSEHKVMQVTVLCVRYRCSGKQRSSHIVQSATLAQHWIFIHLGKFHSHLTGRYEGFLTTFGFLFQG